MKIRPVFDPDRVLVALEQFRALEFFVNGPYADLSLDQCHALILNQLNMWIERFSATTVQYGLDDVWLEGLLLEFDVHRCWPVNDFCEPDDLRKLKTLERVERISRYVFHPENIRLSCYDFQHEQAVFQWEFDYLGHPQVFWVGQQPRYRRWKEESLVALVNCLLPEQSPKFCVLPGNWWSSRCVCLTQAEQLAMNELGFEFVLPEISNAMSMETRDAPFRGSGLDLARQLFGLGADWSKQIMYRGLHFIKTSGLTDMDALISQVEPCYNRSQ